MAKGIVVYDTSYGNTKKVAAMIAETLRECGVDADLFHIREVKRVSPSEYGFLVVGSPTKFGTMSLAMKVFLGKVRREEWADRPFAAFDTENPENIEKASAENKEWSAGEKVADRLREKGMSQLLPVLKSSVIGVKGPLVEGELGRAKEFARGLAVKLTESNPGTSAIAGQSSA